MKKIVKTKIISTKTCETDKSKKKGRWGSALAAGLFGWQVASEQDKWHSRHAQSEEIYTFLVIYDDDSRETIETVKNDEKYNELIMYIE